MYMLWNVYFKNEVFIFVFFGLYKCKVIVFIRVVELYIVLFWWKIWLSIEINDRGDYLEIFLEFYLVM